MYDKEWAMLSKALDSLDEIYYTGDLTEEETADIRKIITKLHEMRRNKS
jgi:hypothetical protein